MVLAGEPPDRELEFCYGVIASQMGVLELLSRVFRRLHRAIDFGEGVRIVYL